MDKPLNALAAFMPRSLDQELQSLVVRYGADAVREATKRATAKRKGRKPEKDWLFLRDWVEQDTDDWLHDREPTELRSNYAIAKAFAEKHPGHNPFATKERIERKLRDKRRWFMLVRAWERSEAEFSADTYLRSLRELIQIAPEKHWSSLLEMALGKIARYREQFGEPAPEKSFSTIEEELSAASPTIVGSDFRPLGLLGARRVRKPVGYSNPQNT